MSKIDEIIERRAEAARQSAIAIENMEEFKKSLKIIADSDAGKYFLKAIVAYSGVFRVPTQLNPTQMVEDGGKRKLYLEVIRPNLEFATRAEIES